MSFSGTTKSDGSSSGYHFKTKVSNTEKVSIDVYNKSHLSIVMLYYIIKDVFLQLREIFAILTQGVEIVQYDVKNARRGVSKFNRILWMVCSINIFSLLY